MSTEVHPVMELTPDGQDNGIFFFVLDESSYYSELCLPFKYELLFPHPQNEYDCPSQLIIRRESDGVCLVEIETYNYDRCETVSSTYVSDTEAVRIFDLMNNNSVEVIYQGPCFE